MSRLLKSLTVLLASFITLLTPTLAAGRVVTIMIAGGDLPVAWQKAPERVRRAEVLDGSGRVLLTAAVNFNKGGNRWQARLSSPTNTDMSGWKWHRLRLLRGTETDGALLPLAKYLPLPQLRVSGPSSFAANSPIRVRTIAWDRRSQSPLPGVLIHQRLTDSGKTLAEADALTDEHGVVISALKLPQGYTGVAHLEVNLDSGATSVKTSKTVEIRRRTTILLTSDKPIYQPGQRVFVRALALDRISRHAAANSKITFEIEDGRGNKVFKHASETNDFGVAAATFQLADEVNMGTFKLRAILGEPEDHHAEVEEKSFTVDRYVLPKFRIEMKLTGENGPAKPGEQSDAKRFYLPGESVDGRLSAKYLFGKPVAGAKVKIRLISFDVQTVPLKSQTLTLGPDGETDFSLRLPDQLTGMALTDGAAPVSLEAEITDGANHAETRNRDLLVANHPVLITAVPEGGELVMGLENRILVRTTDPAGNPLKSQLSGTFSGVVATDDDGFAVIALPAGFSDNFNIEAETPDGKRGENSYAFERRNMADGALMIRTDHAIYKPGDTMTLELLSAQRRGSVYIDVIKSGQIAAQQAVSLVEGRASFHLDLTPELNGTLEIRAYQFTTFGEPVGDRRLVYVEPADGLQIDAGVERDDYHPGETAKVALRVRSADGKPVQAILDVRAVDEAVYTLSRQKPGFAKVFFNLEQELLTPRYEIHGLEAERIFSDTSAGPSRDAAARLLFAAAKAPVPYGLRMVENEPATQDGNSSEEAQYKRLAAQSVDRLLGGLNRYFSDGRNSSGDLNHDVNAAHGEGFLRDADLVDPWGRPFQFSAGIIVADGWEQISIASPERPEGVFNFPIRIKRQAWNGPQPTPGKFLGEMKVTRRDYGPQDLASIHGHVKDMLGAPINDVTVVVSEPVNGETFTAHTGGNGEFELKGLGNGPHRIRLRAKGFKEADIETSALHSRDTLSVEINLEPLPFGLHLKRSFWSPPSQFQSRVQYPAGSNSSTGAILGKVTDPKGLALPGAIVRSKGPQGSKGAEVDATGHYALPYLPSGVYEITVTEDGYSTTVQSGVQVIPNTGARLDFKLGEGCEVIMVRAAALNIDVTSSTSVTSINLSDAVQNFARAGNLTAAFDFAPGFIGGVGGGQVAISGASGLENQYLIGGVNITNSGYGGIGAYAQPQSAGEKSIHTRSYFPETLFLNPMLITDEQGRAELTIPLADNITTWRLSLFASTRDGRMGSTETGIKVFQDFFIDLDLPVALTRGDQVTLPVAIYNYRDQEQLVNVTLEPGDWYALNGDSATKQVRVPAGQVGSASFQIRATKAGRQSLSAKAVLESPEAGRAAGDAVVREIEVVPEGREANLVVNGQLKTTAVHDINLPADTLPDSTTLITRIYPAPLSQAIDGLDSMLQMPGGCFEQTSSSTYPNVLVLSYLKATGKLAPEIQAKAEGYINLGYQRLVSFEVPGGGFSWFGNAPANQILTAYGLMEFSDMAKVYPVDDRVITRTQEWLASRQRVDGSWVPDTEFINEGATNAYNSDKIRIAAYIAWALEHSGYTGTALDRAHGYIQSAFTGHEDPFTLAVLANFVVEGRAAAGFRSRVLAALADAAQVRGDEALWPAGGATPTYATGDNAAIETTGFAVQAFLRAGNNQALISAGLKFLAGKKDALGNWNSTQATIQALRALLLSQEKGASGIAEGVVEVLINGSTAGTLKIDRKNQDLMQQLVFKPAATNIPQRVELRFTGSGVMAYQIVARHHLPWTGGSQEQPLSIKVDYDRSQLAQNDIVTAKVSVRNNQKVDAHQVMVDLGIPPGFELQAEDLDALVSKEGGSLGHLTKYTRTGRLVILYYDGFASGQNTKFSYRLRAKFPVRAEVPASRVYEYYNPEVEAYAAPKKIVVTSP